LAALRPGLAKREMVQQSCHFLFFKEEIVTFNDQICIMIPFESGMNFSVKGEEFFRLIDGITDDTLDLSLDKGKIKIKSDSTTSSMTTLGEDQNVLPSVIEGLIENMKGWKKLPSNFLEGISLCSFSTSSDLSRGVFSCIALRGKVCYSLDSNRSSFFLFDQSLSGDTAFVGGKDATELAKFPVKEFCTDGKWAHFRTEEGVTFSCVLMSGEFPFDKMDKTFAKMKSLPHIDLPKELKGVVDNVNMLAAVDTFRMGKIIDLEINGKEIIIRASNDLGEVTKKISCDYADEEINIGINSNLLSQILQRATSLARDGNMLEFQSGNFQHILMAMPPKGEE